MSTPSSLILLYAVAVSVVLAGYVLYLQLASVRWDESEIRLLERLEVHLAQILRLLEASDVRALLEDPESRRRLFLEFSNYLKEDVVGLIRSRKVSLKTFGLAIVFLGVYHLVRAKAYIACGKNDLHLLSRLELTVLRTLEGQTKAG